MHALQHLWDGISGQLGLLDRRRLGLILDLALLALSFVAFTLAFARLQRGQEQHHDFRHRMELRNGVV